MPRTRAAGPRRGPVTPSGWPVESTTVSDSVMNDGPRARLRSWILGFAAWTVLGLLSAAQNAAWRSYSGHPVNWSDTLQRSLADWYSCAIFTPSFFWLSRRFPIRGRRWWASVPAHLLASLVFIPLRAMIYRPLALSIDPGLVPGTFTDLLLVGFYPALLTYWAVIGVVHAVRYHEESRDRQVEASRLEARLREAELENLKAQLQPHFLFNTLQSISTLIHRDPVAADRMLTDLSDLLRLSLRHTAAQEVPLQEELAFLERYLDIMRVRFGDRMVITVVAGGDALTAMVPSLVLQPLVENAIRHGMADRNDVGRVEVRANREDGMLRIEIQDDGPGIPETGPELNAGIGLANTRERLGRLYGPGRRIEIAGAPGRGLRVALTLPFRTARPSP